MTFEEWWNTKDYSNCCLLRCKRAFNAGKKEVEKENKQLKSDLAESKELIKQLMRTSRDCIAWYCLCDKAKNL